MGLARKGWASLVLVVVTLSMFEQCICDYQLPPICDKIECSGYEMMHSQSEFEIRRYFEHLWMYTRYLINATSYEDGYSQGYNIISDYINGGNKQGMHINKTAPVLIDIFPSSPVSSYQLHFLMPYKLGSTPLSETVWPSSWPLRRLVAVRRFSAPLNDFTIAAELAALKSSLMGTKWQVAAAAQNHTVADYNSPTDTENLVNEIMLRFYEFA